MKFLRIFGIFALILGFAFNGVFAATSTSGGFGTQEEPVCTDTGCTYCDDTQCYVCDTSGGECRAGCPNGQYGSGRYNSAGERDCHSCPTEYPESLFGTSGYSYPFNLYQGQCFNINKCKSERCTYYDGWESYFGTAHETYFPRLFTKDKIKFEMLGIGTGCDVGTKYCVYELKHHKSDGPTPVHFVDADGQEIATYYVVYGAVWSTQNTTVNGNVPYSSVVYPTFVTPTVSPISGKKFVGWYDTPNGATPIIAPASDGMLYGNLTYSLANNYVGTTSRTLYARYEEVAPQTYTVKYECGTGTGTPPPNGTATYNQPFSAEENTCTAPSGYEFAGWSPNDGFTNWVNGTVWKFTTNKTFTAQWRANEYTASFRCNFAQGMMNSPQLIDHTGIHLGETITLPSTSLCIPNPAVVPECGIDTTYEVDVGGLWSRYTNGTTGDLIQVPNEPFVWPLANNIRFVLQGFGVPTTTVKYNCGAVGGTAPGEQRVNYLNCDSMEFSAPDGCTPGDGIEFTGWKYRVNLYYPEQNISEQLPAGSRPQLVAQWHCTDPGQVFNQQTGTCDSQYTVQVLCDEDAAPIQLTNLVYGSQFTIGQHTADWSKICISPCGQNETQDGWDVFTGDPLTLWGESPMDPQTLITVGTTPDANLITIMPHCVTNTNSVKYMCYVGDPTGKPDQATATDYTVRAMDWYGQCDINSNTPVPDYKWRFSYNGLDYNAGETIPSWTYGNNQTFTPAYTATFNCVNNYWRAPTGVSESTAQSVLLGGTLTMPIMPCEVRPEYDGWLETDYAWETRYTQTLISPVPYANCNASSSDLHYRPGDSFPWNCPTDLTFEPLTKFIEKPITVSCGGGSESATYTMTFNNQDEIKQEIIYFFGHSCGGHCLLSNPTGSPTGYNNKIVCATDWGNQPIPDSWVSIENDAQGRICYKTPADTDVQLILAEISLAQITDLDISNITHCPQPVTYKCSEDATDEYNGAPYAVFEREYRIQTPGTVGCESGFAFNNWKNLDDDRIFVAGNTVDVWPYEDEVTLIAQWGEPNTYNITYNCGNDTGTTQTDNATYGENYTVKNNAGYTNCEKPGYSFLGWVFSVNGRTYNEGEVFQPWNYANDATFTAKWSDTGNTYTITYKPNYDGATESNETQNVTYGATFTTKPAGTFYRPGYEMSGWSAPFPQMDQEYAYNIIGDTSLNAQWQMCVEGTYSGATQCTSCPEDYPFSVDGASAIEQCYRNCSFTCTTVACPANSTCTQTDTMYDGTEYYGGTCNADPLNCEILTVTCNANYYFDGTVCQPCPTGMTSPQGSTSSEQCVPVLCDDGQYLNNITCENCPNGYPHSDPNATSQSQCYHDCETPCTEPACPANSTSCTYGTNPNSGAWYFGTDACNATPWVCPIETATCAGGYGWNPTNHTCEPCTGNEASINNSCEPCQDGTQPNADHTACVPCPNWTAGTNGTCEPCAPGYVPNAQATACVPCPAGQHIEHSECKDDVMECGAPHAAYATRTWNPRLGAYGSCQIQECEDGYHVASNACVPNDQLCNVANGRGERIWNGTQWGNCVVSECDPGFEPNASDTACGRCGNYMGADGQPKVSSYIAECEIATCMYQGQKYALENGECRPICNKQDDRTGHMEWNESTKKCVRTCNPGYKMW